jgi:hypothetical protein
MKSLLKHSFGTPALVAALCLLGSSLAVAGITTVKTEGEAAIVNGDKAQAVDDAKRDARRKAIEKGVGTVVTSNTIVRNYQLLSDEIITSARGILVSEQWGEPDFVDGVVKVSLNAKVTADPAAALEDAICTVVKASKNPKVALIMVERQGNANDPYTEKRAERGSIEAKFAQAFMDACFTLMEPGVKVTVEAATGDIDQKVMERIVKNTGAQYIVRGKADIINNTGKKGLVGSTYKSFNASVNLTMYSAETNQIVATATASTIIPALHHEDALKTRWKDKGSTVKYNKFDRHVVEKAVDQLFVRVAKDWSAKATGTSVVTVKVQNVKRFADANAFKKMAQKAFGKGTVTRRSVKGGTAMFDVSVDGGSDAFASKIEGKKVGRYTVEIVEVTTGKIVLNLK